MARDAPVKLGLLLLLALAVAVAGLTRYPEAPIYERAASWPVVGQWVEAARESYLPRPAPPVGERDGPAVEVIRESPPAEDLDVRPRVWVAAGSVLLERPASGAPAVATVGALSNLELHGRAPGWVEVESHGQRGWLAAEALPPQPVAAPSGKGEPPLPLPGRPPDRQRLAVARALLGERERVVPLAGYALHTDLPPGGPVAELERLVPALDERYRERYGVAPIARPVGALVLFEREADYRRLAGIEPGIAVLPSSGHAARGVIGVFAGGRPPGEVVATCLHELTHLVNRRALGPALPPWLEEGLAADLAAAATRLPGGQESETLVPRVIVRGALLERRLPPLAELVALGPEDFLVPLRNELYYAESFLFVRYLVEGDDPGLAAGLRGYLAGVAAGGDAGGEALAREAGRSWEELDRGFRAWIEG